MGGGLSRFKNTETFLGADETIVPLVNKVSEKPLKKTKEGQTMLEMYLITPRSMGESLQPMLLLNRDAATTGISTMQRPAAGRC